MRTFIVGAGATGGYFGGRLAAAGKDVTFVARGDHCQALREMGLEVNSVNGDFKIPKPGVVDAISKIEDPELVLVFVKTYDTAQVARELSRVITARTTVITFQTGLENDLAIRKEIGSDRVFPGLVYINSSRTRPGVIHQISGPCSMTFGARGGSTDPRLAEVERLFRQAEIKATLSTAIEFELWKKLIWISTFAGMTVLFRSPVGWILGHTGGEQLFRRCFDEAFSVAAAQRVSFSAAERTAITGKIDYYKNEGRNAKTSLLLDIENGRRTEIETLHGPLVRYARESEVDTPLLETIYAIVQVHEARVAAT